eukprot:GHVT01070083.1.p1 GENE.GHVT01070083.1~~GHVT01070083.1.p1  ORF type:complete len:197 (-),score=0.14 GHVT01070083.1:815-1405(-)
MAMQLFQTIFGGVLLFLPITIVVAMPKLSQPLVQSQFPGLSQNVAYSGQVRSENMTPSPVLWQDQGTEFPVTMQNDIHPLLQLSQPPIENVTLSSDLNITYSNLRGLFIAQDSQGFYVPVPQITDAANEWKDALPAGRTKNAFLGVLNNATESMLAVTTAYFKTFNDVVPIRQSVTGSLTNRANQLQAIVDEIGGL